MGKTNCINGNEVNDFAVKNSTKASANTRSASVGTASVHSATKIEGTQWQRYNKPNGHGFAAEDGNAQWDRWYGKKVKFTGPDNVADGADRYVNGQGVQTKYHKTASSTIRTSFNKQTGEFRYDGMKLEVPKDQYDECVRLMREHIKAGHVPGVTDPNKATEIVVKGHYTYKESCNLTKAGTRESIMFDVRTQMISCAGAGAISGGVTFIKSMKGGKGVKESLSDATKAAAGSSATALAGGVLAQQALRTTAGRNAAAAAIKAVKPIVDNAMKTEVGRKVLEKTATVVAGKAVTGQAAANVLTKAARTNAITSAAMFVATSIPDTVKLCQGKISSGDYAENMAANAAGIGGGWGGASAGAAIGTAICPGVGTVIGGLVGGIGGGMVGSSIVRGISSFFR